MADQKRNIKNKDSSLFKSLTRLFSGPIVDFRQQAQIRFRRRQLDKFNFNSATGKQFQKTAYNPFEAVQSNVLANQSRAERYSDFDQMEFSLHPDTKIAIPGGYMTIKELADKCSEDENYQFIVYSYDHNKKQIVPAIGKQARKTCHELAYKITFDNGTHIIGSFNHRLLKRDGTYSLISDLKEGDAMMPFYRKDLVHGQKDEGDGYRWIYTMHKDDGRKKGWIAEHILVAEWIAGRRLLQNEVVHHKNFIKYDNNPDNLQIMDNDDHLSLHQSIINEQRKKDGWWDEFRKSHSERMKQNNPAERKDITFWRIVEVCEREGFNLQKLCNSFDTDPQTIKRKLKSHGYDNFTIFAKAYDENYNPSKNRRKPTSYTIQGLYSVYQKGDTLSDLSRKLKVSPSNVIRTLARKGYRDYEDFVKQYSNLKIVSIEEYGTIDLYDLTVDGYKNFATDTVISHNTPEIASGLDLYADEMTTHGVIDRILDIKSPNQEIRGILDNLYYDVLNVEHNLFGWCRTMCKYGDMFLYLDIDPELGVKTVIGLPSPEIERLEGQDKTNPNYTQYQWNSGGLTFEKWQIAHFRILGQDKYAPYGTSVLEPARRIWRQLNLLEDAMMAYRIVRAPDRRVFYIDVGNIDPDSVEQFMLKIQNQMKRNMVVDPTSGRVDLRYNPMSIDEDYFVPVRGQSNTKIDTLQGGNFTGDIDDVKYLRDKLFSALKIPQAYLSRDEKASEDKTTLAQKDIRFARTIQRLQAMVVSELEQVGRVHLFTLGYRNEDLLNFKLSLNNPSKISELQELEHWKTKFDVANQAKDFFSSRWISERIFKLSEQEHVRIQRERAYDKNLEAAAEGGGEGGGGGGGGLGPDLGGGEPAPEGGEEPGGPTPNEALPPAKRSDNGYKPVAVDRRDAKGRKHSMNSSAIPEAGLGATARTMFPGYDNLIGLAKLSENVVKDDEYKLLKVNSEIKNLLTSLENMDANKIRKTKA